MRCLMVATEYPPAKGYGLGRYASELANALAAADHTVHAVTGNHGDGGPSYMRGAVVVHNLREVLPLKHFHWVGEVVLGNVALLERAVEVVGEHGPFDILLAHNWLAALAAKSLKSIFGMPLVLFMHDTEPGKRGNKLTREQVYIAEMETWACAHADAIVANSAFLADEIVRFHGVPREKIHVIPPGVNPARFEVDCHLPDFRALFAAPDEKLVLYVGRLSPVKGVDLLVEAIPLVLRQRPATRFVIAGDGVLRSALEARARQSGISERVRFTGHLSDRVLGALYRVADLVVVPSRYEPFGMVALEAMSCSAPLVVADTGGLREVVPGRSPVRYARPNDHRALAAAVCTALGAEIAGDDRDRLRSHAARLTWARSAAAVIGVCERVAKERAGVGAEAATEGR